MTQLTAHFTLEEMTYSLTAKQRKIDNVLTQQAIINLTYLCAKVLEPLRKAMGTPIMISSGYRCPALNKAVKGVDNSQHMTGQAADLSISGDMKKGWKWFEYIRDHLTFDQLIWEHDAKGVYWIHVSYNAFGQNRKKVITNLLKK